MNTFFRFFYEFTSIFFGGIGRIFDGFVGGVTKMFNFKEYSKIINTYKDYFTGREWVFVAISIAVLLIIVLAIGFLIFLLVRKIIRRRTNNLSKEELMDEIANLNDKVVKLMKEKDELMALKVSQLGINPDDNKEDTKTE